MKQVSFIHMADLHLDAPFSSLADAHKAEIRRNEIIACLKNIVERARVQNINLLIISGDFFEDSCVRSSTILTARNLFSELYNTEIIISPGNHDPFKENSYYNTLEWGSNVHILENAQQVLHLEKYNTCIYNMGARGDVSKDYSVIRDKDMSQESFNFLLFHGTVDMPFVENNYNSVTSKELLSLEMDYIALGHMHCYSRIQNGKTLMVNPGSPEPLGFDEEGNHGFIQGTITISDEKEKNIDTVYISSSARNYFNADINITGCASDEEVIKKMSVVPEIKFSPQNLYSVTLKGFITRSYNIEMKKILKAFEQNCFYMRIKNETSIQFDYEQYLEDPGIKGEFVRRIMDMQESAVSEEKRETLFMALQYGLQAIENGRVDT